MKQLTIIGNLGFDAVVKEANGNKFLSFSVAVNESFKKADGTKVESTDWVNCTYRNIGLAQYLKKGDKVMVQGNMKVNVFQNKDRQHCAGINLSVFNVTLLGGKKQEEPEGEVSLVGVPQGENPITNDDLPF